MHRSSWQLWRDRRGRISGLRIATLALLLLPLALAALAGFSDARFGARPLNDLIHRSGYWALMFLLLSLAVTPFRRVGRYGALVDVRRMIGVGAFCYAALHISLYVADQMFDLAKVASEIVLRLYLTIGFIALSGLAVLAVTSTDGMVKRLGGRRWLRLHQVVYGIALLALIHFFQQTKADVWVPTFVAGLFCWLMGYRILLWVRGSAADPPAWMLLVLALGVGVATFIAEAVGIGIAFKVSPMAVLETAFDYDLETWDVRPGWLVLAAGLIVAAVDAVRARWRGPKSKAGSKPNSRTGRSVPGASAASRVRETA
jgi:sulfoxide reductase heme-binding subunit YedZ